MSKSFRARGALRVLLACVMTAAWAAGDACADTVFLKRGGTIQGEAAEGESTVEVKMDGGSATFNKEEIERIEKNDIKHEPGSNALTRIKSGASKAVSSVKRQTAKSLQGVKKNTSGWMKPVGRSKDVVAKEKALNDNLTAMQRSLKKMHARDKVVSREKRALKKEGFNLH